MNYYRLTVRQQRWREHWPVGWIIILATIQLILTFAIIGLEVASTISDVYHSMIFAGYYCSLFFMITWISMFTVTCCNRHSMGCATHVLVENTLSIIAASVLISFDGVFISNPYICLYAADYDCNISSDLHRGIYDSTFYTVKMAVIKAQLACAVVMLATNVIYIVIYIYVTIKSRNNRSIVEPQMYEVQQSSIIIAQPVVNRQATYTTPRHTVECPHCHNLVLIG